MIDLAPDPDLDDVAAITLGVAEKLREDNPQRLFDELTNLCQWHPAKAAQIIMTFAAWFDDAPEEILNSRVQTITHPKIDWYAVELVTNERDRRIGRGLNRLERREVIRRLSGRVSDAQIGELIGISRIAVKQLRSYMAKTEIAS